MIASAGPCLPLAVLHASGRYAGALGWNADRPTPRADAWLERKFAPWARSIVEDWASGVFDGVDSVLFSRAEDNAQRLYYYISELRRRGLLAGPEPLLFDAALVQRASSEARTIAEVRRLAAFLSVNDDALEAAIAAQNASRAGPASPGATRVCLLTGTPPPDRRLHDAVEAAGFFAIGQTLAELWADPGPAAQTGTGDPAAAIGAALHRSDAVSRAFASPARRLSQVLGPVTPAAAVLWCSEDEEAIAWLVPGLRASLEEMRVPHLVLTRRSWTADDGALEEIARFLKEIAS